MVGHNYLGKKILKEQTYKIANTGDAVPILSILGYGNSSDSQCTVLEYGVTGFTRMMSNGIYIWEIQSGFDGNCDLIGTTDNTRTIMYMDMNDEISKLMNIVCDQPDKSFSYTNLEILVATNKGNIKRSYTHIDSGSVNLSSLSSLKDIETGINGKPGSFSMYNLDSTCIGYLPFAVGTDTGYIDNASCMNDNWHSKQYRSGNCYICYSQTWHVITSSYRSKMVSVLYNNLQWIYYSTIINYNVKEVARRKGGSNNDQWSAITDLYFYYYHCHPSAPQNLQHTAGDSQIALSWQAPSSNGASITNYRIYRGTFSNNETYLKEVSCGTTTYTDTGLTSDTTYYYKVTAVSSPGESNFSNEVSTTPLGNTSSCTNSIPDTQSALGTAVTIPIKVNDADGIAEGYFTITFDSSILKATDVQTTSLTNGFLLSKNLNTLGEARISSTSFISDPNHTGGVLVNITFTVSSSAQSGDTTTLTLTKADMKDIKSNNILSITKNGTFEEDSILGSVNSDGTIDLGDAILILRHAAGLITHF